MSVAVQITGGRAFVGPLPEPALGHRWVGPLPALTVPEDYDGTAGPWASRTAGDEITACYSPIFRPGAPGPSTETSGRRCHRSSAGWWVEVPDRPSALACQVRHAGGVAEVGVRYSGPIRDRSDLDHEGAAYWSGGGAAYVWRDRDTDVDSPTWGAPAHWEIRCGTGLLTPSAREQALAWGVPLHGTPALPL